MKGALKILKIVGIFFSTLFLLSLVWYAVEMLFFAGEQRTPYIDYVLYLLGYGDIDTPDHYAKTMFSVLSLFTVTLLSSVFTVSLFDLRNKLKIAPRLNVVHGADGAQANIQISTLSKDVYNLTATLIVKCGETVETETVYLPFLPKKETYPLTFDVAPGTVCFKYLRETFSQNGEPTHLIITVKYTDVDNGQEYTICQKYQYTLCKKCNIAFVEGGSGEESAAAEIAIRSLATCNVFPLDLARALPVNSEYMTLTQEGGLLGAQISMKNGAKLPPDAFTMAFMNNLLGNDWSVYYDLNCALTFDVCVQEKIDVTLEFKYLDGTTGLERIYRHIFVGTGTDEHFTLPLSAFRKEDLKRVKELCFTVFRKDLHAKNLSGAFTVRNCTLTVQK